MTKTLLPLLILAVSHLGATAHATGFLLITASRFAYEQPGYDETDPPVVSKSSNTDQKFALELTDELRARLVPHGPDHPGGVKLGLRTGYRDQAETPNSETLYVWWISRTEDAVHVHGWPRGHEMILGQRADHSFNVANTDIRFRDLESIAFGSYISYVRDMSGANIGVNIRYVPEGDSALADAAIITAKTSNQPQASCSNYLAPFFAEAFVQ